MCTYRNNANTITLIILFLKCVSTFFRFFKNVDNEKVSISKPTSGFENANLYL